MALTGSSDQSATFNKTKENDKDGLSPYIVTHAAANTPQKPSGIQLVDLTSSDAAKSTEGTNVTDVAGDSESPFAKRLKFHNNNAITVVVGAEKAVFTIHRGPICNASGFFKALFESSFKESSEKAVTTEEHTPETFDQFLEFAYSHDMYLNLFRDRDKEGKCLGYSGLHVLAAYLNAPGLKDAVIRVVFH